MTEVTIRQFDRGSKKGQGSVGGSAASRRHLDQDADDSSLTFIADVVYCQ